MEKLKIGICGLNRGRIHLMNCLISKNLDVVAVCDNNKAVADGIKEKYGSEKEFKVYYNYRELLADPEVEAVIVATPIDCHTDIVIDAFNSGKHVISEVIVATTIEDIHRVGQAMKKSGKMYIMAENYCYSRPMLIVENLVKEGLFGEIYYAESDYLKDFQEYHPNFPNIGGWRQKVYFGRKGDTYITHSLGPLLHLMKEKVVKVSAMGAGNHFDMEADDTCVLLLETEKGHVIRLRSSFVSPRPDNVTYYGLQGMNGCYQAPQGPKDFHKIYFPEFCKAGGWNNPGQWRNLYDLKDHIPEKWREYWNPYDYDNQLDNDTYELYDSGLRYMLEEFADCILQGKESPVSFADAANWTAAGILSEASVTQGSRTIEIPTFAEYQ